MDSKHKPVYLLCLSKVFSALVNDISKSFHGLLVTYKINLRATTSIYDYL